MKIDELEKKWENFANVDPLWAILSEDDKKGNKWELEDFFEVGRRNAKEFMKLALHCKPNLVCNSFLDFGCGVGRMTQGFACNFVKGVGVDISSKMIELANRYNKYQERISYLVNKGNDLKQFESNTFNMVFSHIVLQHVPPNIHKSYISEFGRILRPDGLCIFQLPEPFSKDWGSESFTDENKMKLDMYGSAEEVVVELVERSGGKILRIEEDGACGPEHKSLRYVFQK